MTKCMSGPYSMAIQYSLSEQNRFSKENSLSYLFILGIQIITVLGQIKVQPLQFYKGSL